MSTIQSRGRAPLWASTIATVAGLGKLRPGPGTWGSALAVLTWFLISQVIPPELQRGALILLSLAVIAIGIPAATKVASAYGNKDPQNVIIDEVAGQWITLIAVPVAWKSLLVGFILFRGFDIVKPPPVRMLERLPDGVGIVIDDVGAGIYALIVMQLAFHFGLLPS